MVCLSSFVTLQGSSLFPSSKHFTDFVILNFVATLVFFLSRFGEIKINSNILEYFVT